MKFIYKILNFFWITFYTENIPKTIEYIKLNEFSKQKELKTKHILMFLYINWYVNQDLNLTSIWNKHWKLEFSKTTQRHNIYFTQEFFETLSVQLKPDLYFSKENTILYPLEYLIDYYNLDEKLFSSNLKTNWLIKFKENPPYIEITKEWLHWWLEFKKIKEEQTWNSFLVINIQTFKFFLNYYENNLKYKLTCQQPIQKWSGYITDDWHCVRSKAELIIDNWLYSHNIIHSYEKTLPIHEFYYYDFYIKEIDVYIEYWGLEDEKYLKNKQIKLEKYKENNLKLIEITNKEERELDSFLKNKLMSFWYQFNSKK